MNGLVAGEGKHRFLIDPPRLARPVVGASDHCSGPVAVRFGGFELTGQHGDLHQSPQRRRFTSLVPEDLEVVEGLSEPLPGLRWLLHGQLAGRPAGPRPVQEHGLVVAVVAKGQHGGEAL